MKMTAFRVQNYRSVIDSGWCDLDELTVIVGKNESGKTSLLKALWKFNPFEPAPYDLVFANILARPLCAMAKDLAQHLAPGGTVILAGLLSTQRRWVLHAHRQAGLVLESTLHEGRWATLVLRKR